MLHWISANLSTILISIALLAIVVLIIRGLVRVFPRPFTQEVRYV